MKRKEFIKSLLGLPLMGLFGFGESQKTEQDSPLFTEFKPREFENLYNTTLTLNLPEPDPKVLEELKRIAEQKVYAVYPDGEVIDVTDWKVTYINE